MHGGPGVASHDLLADLNDPQREAVAHTDGPLLILAGPGSGKTRVVTRRAARLATTAAAPAQVLAITFTNKAAGEMRERIGSLRGAGGVHVHTFHAFCTRMLRAFHARAGIERFFTIFDRTDRLKLVRQATEAAGYSPSNWPTRTVEQEISRAKNAMETPDSLAERQADWRGRSIAQIFRAYEDLVTRMGGLDFDDLLVRLVRLLACDDELRSELEDRYRYVLIDEYQDTNRAQYEIARLLTRTRRNLCATGDPDQSIYGWRGASIENILRFEGDYPDAKVVRLEQNYRSTAPILTAAGSLIARNVRRKEKLLWTVNAEGPAVGVVEFETSGDEARAVAARIGKSRAEGLAPGGVAVFYRVNSLSREIEEALRARGIAYQVARGVEFYGRKEIKDALAYLRVLVNPSDKLSLLRIINVPPRGIGAATIRRLVERARAAGSSILEVLSSDALRAFRGRAGAKLRTFSALLGELRGALDLNAPQALEQILRATGLRALYAGESDGDDDPARNLDELVSAASDFGAANAGAMIVDWLEHTALVSDVDSLTDRADAVTIMTLHAAKGLEFDEVYIIGLEEGLLPFRRHVDEPYDAEEERRLFFVGMTRARRRLTLSHARFRMRRGVARRTIRSPFLDELPAGAVECTLIDSAESGQPSQNNGRGLPPDLHLWTVGTLVCHPDHGLGRILSVEAGLKHTHVRVQYRNGRVQPCVLEFTPLRRVDFEDVGDLDCDMGA